MLEEESAIFSKNERYKNNNAHSESPKCSNCNKVGHVASRRYLKERKDTRFNHFSVKNENRERNSDITCYNCQGRRHMAKHCRRPKKRLERPGLAKDRNGGSNYPGNESRPSEIGSRPMVQFIQ